MRIVKTSIALLLSAALMVSAVPGQLSVASAAEAAGSVSKPTVNSKHTVTWDCIYFGNYWQEDTNGDGKANEEDQKTPIKWRVLTVDGDYAFLMSDKILDWAPFVDPKSNAGEYAGSTLLYWLNHNFAAAAFDFNTETNNIKLSPVDLKRNVTGANKEPEYQYQAVVYLLSYAEATKAEYGFDTSMDDRSYTRRTTATSYAKTHTSHVYDEDWWWLRTWGKDQDHMIPILRTGNPQNGTDGVLGEYRSAGIRPVLWLNLKTSKTWKKAGTVTASSKLPTTSQSASTKKPSKGATAKSSKEVIKGKAPKVSYKLKTNKLTVKYKASKKAAGFQIRYKLGKGNWNVKTYNTKKSVSKTIKGLKKGKYTIQVRSFTKGKKSYSKWSKAKILTVKKAAKKKAKKTVKKTPIPTATDER